jgi:hypothetical protein
MAVGGSRQCKFCGTALDGTPAAGRTRPADSGPGAGPFVAPEQPSRAWVPPAGAQRPFATAPAGSMLPPPVLPPPRRSRRPSRWLITAVVGIVGVFAVIAFSVHQVADPKPLPGEEAAINGVGEWVTFHDPNRAFSIDFPEEPDVGEESSTATQRSRFISCRVLRVTYYVRYVDFFSGFTGGVYGENYLDGRADDFAKDVGGSLLWKQRVAVGGLPASEFVVDAPDGVWHLAAVLTGKRLFFIGVSATVDAAAGYRRFVGSFTPLAPGN